MSEVIDRMPQDAEKVLIKFAQRTPTEAIEAAIESFTERPDLVIRQEWAKTGPHRLFDPAPPCKCCALGRLMLEKNGTSQAVLEEVRLIDDDIRKGVEGAIDYRAFTDWFDENPIAKTIPLVIKVLRRELETRK